MVLLEISLEMEIDVSRMIVRETQAFVARFGQATAGKELDMEDLIMQGTDTSSTVNAAWMEHQVLDHIKQALRVTLDWKVPSVGLHQKLSSMHFTLKSFQRHLDRLMSMEEEGGYMALVAETKPNLCSRVDQLAMDHDSFRESIEELLPEVEALCQYSSEGYEDICEQIYQLLDRVDQHDHAEVELLNDAFLFDEGGEG